MRSWSLSPPYTLVMAGAAGGAAVEAVWGGWIRGSLVGQAAAGEGLSTDGRVKQAGPLAHRPPRRAKGIYIHAHYTTRDEQARHVPPRATTEPTRRPAACRPLLPPSIISWGSLLRVRIDGVSESWVDRSIDCRGQCVLQPQAAAGSDPLPLLAATPGIMMQTRPTAAAAPQASRHDPGRSIQAPAVSVRPADAPPCPACDATRKAASDDDDSAGGKRLRRAPAT